MTLDIRWFAPIAIIATMPMPGIAKQYMTEEQARALIFAQAQEFVSVPASLSAEHVQSLVASGVEVHSAHHKAWKVQAGGQLLGWYFVDQVVGKHEFITYAAGINADGTLRQFQIIDYREAYGYQVRELKWRDQFVGKSVSDPVRLGVDIANISGATLSCRHMADGIKRLLFLHKNVLR